MVEVTMGIALAFVIGFALGVAFTFVIILAMCYVEPYYDDPLMHLLDPVDGVNNEHNH